MPAKSHYEDEQLSCFAGFRHMLFGTSPRPRRLVPSTSDSNLSEKRHATSPVTYPEQPRTAAVPRQIRRRSTRPASVIQADTIAEAEPDASHDYDGQQQQFQQISYHSSRYNNPPAEQAVPASSQQLKTKREPGRKYSTTLDKWVMRSDPATQGNPNQHARAQPYLAYKTQPSSVPVDEPTATTRTNPVFSSAAGKGKPASRRTSTFPTGVAQIDTAASQDQGSRVDMYKIDSPMGVMGSGGGMVMETAITVPVGGGNGARRTSDWFG